MTDADAFMAAIIANPDDDGPRLAYTDWLEEQGDSERSEFVRIQLRIAEINMELVSDEDCGVPECEGCIEREQLRRREQELLIGSPTMQFGATAHFSDYLSDLGVEDHDGWDWRYRRGFVEKITCTAADWERYGDAICRCQPVREVVLTTRPQLDISDWKKAWPTISRWILPIVTTYTWEEQ